MKLYQYKALSQSGEKISGEIEAADKGSVLNQLDRLGHYVVDVQEVVKSKAGVSSNSSVRMFGGPSSTKVTLFTRELSMLLKAGLPLDKALDLLQRDLQDAKFSKLIAKLRKDIGDGKSFFEALKNAGSAFPPVYINMIRVAEASGTLDVVLDRIAQTREKEEKLKSKAMSAMLYPSFLIITAITAIIVMLVYVVPKFKDLILNSSSEIPESSQFVIAMSDWLITNGITLSMGILAFIIAMFFMMKNPGFRQSFDAFLFKMPVIGHIMQLNLTIRFCRTMGTLLENGVELPVAMSLTKNVLDNKVAESVISESSDALRKGQNFLDPITKSKLFPPVVINMLQVGEETGNLSSSSIYMADMFEDKLETSIQRFFTILEPLIILFVSVFVAGIIISIIGSVLSLNDLAV